jgi:hypothetical protein
MRSLEIENLKLLIVIMENLDMEIGLSQTTKDDIYRAIADRMQQIQEEFEEELIRKSSLNGSRT